jgi:hypothetical protein
MQAERRRSLNLLWFLLHRAPAGLTEHILGIGAVCALWPPAFRAQAPGPCGRRLPGNRRVIKPSRGSQSGHRGRVVGNNGRGHGGCTLRLSATGRGQVEWQGGGDANAKIRPCAKRPQGPGALAAGPLPTTTS